MMPAFFWWIDSPSSFQNFSTASLKSDSKADAALDNDLMAIYYKHMLITIGVDSRQAFDNTVPPVKNGRRPSPG